MRSIFLLILVSLFGFQQTHGRELQSNVIDFKNTNELLDINYRYNSHRDISDLWNKIKSKIIAAWESLKKIANNTKIHVKEYVQKIKEKIQKISKAFEEKLEKIKKDLQKLIESAGEVVNSCLKEDEEILENILKEILTNVTKCISKKMKDIENIEQSYNLIEYDESIFMESIQNKIQERLETCEDANECLDTVKEEIISDMENTSWKISEKALETRNAINEGLDIVVTCVTKGLLAATSIIVDETVHIIQCVKDQHKYMGK